MAKVEVLNIDIDDIRLKRNVLIGYTDISAAGSRVLLGASMRLEYYKISIEEITNQVVACIRDTPPAPNEEDFGPFQILNCKYEEYSIVIINSVLSSSYYHYIINRILDLCCQSHVEKIILLSSLRIPMPTQKFNADLFEMDFNCASVTKCPQLSDDVKISDAFLNTFLQMVQVENIPTCCLLIVGNKASLGKANLTDGSHQAISRLHQVLTEITSLQFDLSLSLNLIYRGRNETTVDMVSEIYA